MVRSGRGSRPPGVVDHGSTLANQTRWRHAVVMAYDDGMELSPPEPSEQEPETAKTTVHLDQEVKRRVIERSRRHRQTMSGAVNILLIAALDREDQEEGRRTAPPSED